MSQNLPPLNWLRAFEASARLGNFTRAAEELLITPAAVSYQVRSLEEHLGYPLFDRNHRVLELTRLGQTYLPSVAKAFADLSIATVSVFGQRDVRPVRFRCLNSFGQLWMIPRWKRFHETHPDIPLQMISASWAETLNPDQLGIDIRFGDGSWSDGVVELLYNDPVIPVCHPELALAWTGDLLGQLAEAPRLDIMGVLDTWESFFRTFDRDPGERISGLQVDQTLSALELAAQGLGHALVLESLARPYLDDGRLMRSCNHRIISAHSHYLVTPGPRRALSLEAQVFCDWLKTEVSEPS
ncbi:LysR substrate-binding domain-containing protein [Roseibium sp. RKSG952]|uniref:LysR substrate-binding domain-containing protein n=1 Tax=Roseibium sp. RKSG952 TaxID=2529384 RepID=UPI0012BD104B|nr:LysR substrate-binding domain-containing protein [Roseibium sp. RKSG952]MTH96494.1 LysR family transcriptional regulator [Roseibium sp. RKSG952]